MSADLETLLRDAADGPVPALDLAALQRAGRRRRRLTHVVGAAGAAAIVAIAGIALATTADSSPRPSVADEPDGSLGPDRDENDGTNVDGLADAEDGAPVTMEVRADGDRCSLELTAEGADGPLRGALWLYPVWCAADPQGEDLHRTELPTLRAPALDGTLHPEQLLAGLVDADVIAVRVRTDLVDVTVRTTEVPSPGAVQMRGYAVVVPIADGATEPGQRRFTYSRADGSVDAEVAATWALFDLEWSTAGEPEPGHRTTGQPLADVPVTLPDDVPPLGTWRPDPPPVDLSPLSMRGTTADAWYVNEDPYEPAYPVAREVVADRLGGEDRLVVLCEFLTAQVTRAEREVAVPSSEREFVPAVVTHLVLGAAEVVGGDGMTATIVHTCGLGDPFGAG